MVAGRTTVGGMVGRTVARGRRGPSRDEDGVAGLEALAFGVLIFVFGTLVVVNAWGVVDAKMATTAAAREATRAVVESDGTTDLGALAGSVAAGTLAGHGRDPDRLTATALTGSLARCARVRVEVTYRVPTIQVPLLGGFGDAGIEVRGTHTEVVDPFRSGLAGEADCAF
jgi:hypothetical protein